MELQNIKTYYPLGRKTLFMIIFKKSLVLVLMIFFLFFGVFAFEFIPPAYYDVAINMMFGYFVLIIISFISVFLLGWLEYFRYKILIDERNLKMERGLISTEQIGVPYRRIQDIKIKRTLIDQIFGVSNIIINVLDSDKNESFEQDESIILPCLDKDIALEIQDIVIKKAQVEQIHVLSSQRV